MLVIAGRSGCRACPGAAEERPGRDDQQELREHDDADQRADRQVLEEALAQLGEVDVQHHHDEKEEHRDGANVDDDQDHRQELRTHKHEEAGRIDEGEDEVEHGVHGIAGGDHHEGGSHRHEGEDIEEDRRDIHTAIPCRRPDASPHAARIVANAGPRNQR